MTMVVDDDEGGEVLHHDFPHWHAQLRAFLVRDGQDETGRALCPRSRPRYDGRVNAAADLHPNPVPSPELECCLTA
jgi:hypothetical protein